MANLTITSGPQAGTSFILANRPLSLGRDPTRDIQVVDPKVSRKHAMVRATGSGHSIAPAKALNGVFVNGEPAEDEVMLRDGDEIKVGDTTLRFDLYTSQAIEDAVHERKVADRAARDQNTMM